MFMQLLDIPSTHEDRNKFRLTEKSFVHAVVAQLIFGTYYDTEFIEEQMENPIYNLSPARFTHAANFWRSIVAAEENVSNL